MRYIITLCLCLCFLPHILFSWSHPNNYCYKDGLCGLADCYDECYTYFGYPEVACAKGGYTSDCDDCKWYPLCGQQYWCFQENYIPGTKCGDCGLCDGNGYCIAHKDKCETDSLICNKPSCEAATTHDGHNCHYSRASKGTLCESDDNECTVDSCDDHGRCIHDSRTKEGDTCSKYPENECADQICQNGKCKIQYKSGACSELKTHACIIPYCQYDESTIPDYPHTYCATIDLIDHYECCESDDECADKSSHTKKCFGLDIDPIIGGPTPDTAPGRCRYERIKGNCSTEDAELGQLLGIPDADYTLYCKPDYPDCFGWGCIDPSTNEAVTSDVQGECRHNKINRCCKKDIDCAPHATTSCTHWFCDSNDKCNYEYKTACCKVDATCTPPHPVLLDWECDLSADPVMEHHAKVEGEGVCHYEKLIDVNECTPLRPSGTLVQNEDNFSLCTLLLGWVPAYDGVCTDIDHFDISLIGNNGESELIGNIEYEASDREHPDYKHEDQIHYVIIENVKCLNAQEEFRITAKDSAGNALASNYIIIPKNTN